MCYRAHLGTSMSVQYLVNGCSSVLRFQLSRMDITHSCVHEAGTMVGLGIEERDMRTRLLTGGGLNLSASQTVRCACMGAAVDWQSLVKSRTRLASMQDKDV